MNEYTMSSLTESSDNVGTDEEVPMINERSGTDFQDKCNAGIDFLMVVQCPIAKKQHCHISLTWKMKDKVMMKKVSMEVQVVIIKEHFQSMAKTNKTLKKTEFLLY